MNGTPRRITATDQVWFQPAQMLGFFVWSGTGSLTFRSGREDGEQIGGTFKPSPGWYPFPIAWNTGLHVTIAGELDVTIVAR